jgi:sulfate adenylyltransferase
MPANLISPHGGTLIDLIVDPDYAHELDKLSFDWPEWTLTDRQLCDLELLATGGFSPLRGFIGEADYHSVCSALRLANGMLWPIPITLDVSSATAAQLVPSTMLALRDPEGVMLAAMEVEELWQPDREAEAQAVFGTTDPCHPGVERLLRHTNSMYVAGRLEVLQLQEHHDHRSLRLTPGQLRERFAIQGWQRVVAFQTRNPLHRAHVELTKRAASDLKAKLLIHPVVGATKVGDVDHHTRVRCYRAIMPSYPEGTAMLALLPLAMRMAGPREAVWHAIIRKNHGVTHFIVGRDHAGPGEDSTGRSFYQPYEAQELLGRYEAELELAMVPFRQMVYRPDVDNYVFEDEIPKSTPVLSISGTDLRRRLAEGQELPIWFTSAEVASELRRSYPPRIEKGITIFFTGLSGSGKSTIANALHVKLLEMGDRTVTLLDGDIVRRHLSSELGFSKEHRDINIRRIGFVAAEITKNGGIAICAPIAPYEATREAVRQMVEPHGAFILVHVSTALGVCEQRDRKGLYAKARAGLLPQFTGISDPYETPTNAEVIIDAAEVTAEEASQRIIRNMQAQGYIVTDGHACHSPREADFDAHLTHRERKF